MRASQADRALYCPASVAESAGKVDPTGSAAQLGTAYHEVMREWCQRGERLDEDAVAEVADQHAVPIDELLDLLAVTDWNPVGGEAEVTVQYRVEDPTGTGMIAVPGHVDWLRHDPALGTVTVLDYKTGHPPAHAADRPVTQWGQGILYGLAAKDYYLAKMVTVIRYWVRLGEEGYESLVIDDVTEDRYRRMADRIVLDAERQAHLDPADRTYRILDTWTGCRGCAGARSCPALEQRSAQALALAGSPVLQIQSADDALTWWRHQERIAGMEAARKAVNKSALLDYLTEHGPIQIDGDIHLTVVKSTQSGKTYYNPGVRTLEEETHAI